jgi:uncharacterized membrane protein
LVVALVGAFAAMYLTIVPLYGIGAKSLAALVGTAVSLAAIALLALIAVHAAHISGTAGEDRDPGAGPPERPYLAAGTRAGRDVDRGARRAQ